MSSNFLSNITGFNSKYIQIDTTKYGDETDYSAVDFCKGEDEKENQITEIYNFDTDLIYPDEEKEGFTTEG